MTPSTDTCYSVFFLFSVTITSLAFLLAGLCMYLPTVPDPTLDSNFGGVEILGSLDLLSSAIYHKTRLFIEIITTYAIHL